MAAVLRTSERQQHSRLLLAFAIHTDSPYARSVNSVHSQTRTETFCRIIVGVTGYFVGGWTRVTRDILEKTENKIADCSNATVSDGFNNFNEQMQTTFI
jgi:hypothetical protein